MYKHLLFLITLLYLGGCSLQPSTPIQPGSSTSWEQHQAELTALQDWDLSGKIGIRTDSDSQSASLTWVQTGATYEINIRGPWGQGGAGISGQPGQVVVDIAGDGTYTGTDPEQILYEQLGWQLPVSDIYWWIRGLPAPQSAFEYSLQQNRLAQLQQSGWQIDYLRYNSLSPALPDKIRMSRQDLRITIVIHSWIRL